MIPQAEFIVVGCVEGSNLLPDPYRTVIGRCGGVPIRLGDTFDAVYQYEDRRYPDEFGSELPRLGERCVSLRVACIRAFGRCLDELGEGATGSLLVQGDGMEMIQPGWVLGSSAHRPVEAARTQ